jgi:hypothetical protein
MNPKRSIPLLAVVAFPLILTACAGRTPAETPAFLPTAQTTPTASPAAMAALPTPTLLPALTDTPIVSPSMGQITGDSSVAFVRETIPDGTNFKANEVFRKTWTLRNDGATTWDSRYALTRVSSDPAGETLGGPDRIALTGEVKPGEEVGIGVDLIAPAKDGRYTIYYELVNASGQTVSHGRFWAAITVGNITQAAAAATTKGASAILTGFEASGQTATVHFCMTFPSESRQWMVSPGTDGITLTLDGSSIAASDGGGSQNCYDFNFPVAQAAVDQAEHISVTIQSIMEDTNFPHERCEEIKPGLQAQYPGLDFTCEGEHSYYSHLQLPAGMTEAEADRLIVEAITGTIHGPWALTIR